MAGIASPSEVDFFLRDFLKKGGEWKRYASSYEALASRVGVSKPQVLNVKEGSRGAGPETETGFANLLAGGSVDELRRMARAFCEKHGLDAKPDRYPARAALLRRLNGVLPSDVAAELQSEGHKEAEQWGEADWLLEAADALRAHQRRVRMTEGERRMDRLQAELDTAVAKQKTRPSLHPKRRR